MTTTVGITDNVLISFFTTPNLYKPTRYIDVTYEVMFPKFGTKIFDAHTSKPVVISKDNPVVLKGTNGDMQVCMLGELARNYVFTNGTPITKPADIMGKYENADKFGAETLKPKSGAVKVRHNIFSTKQVIHAIFVPRKYVFNFNGVIVNDPRVNTHADGDYIVRIGNTCAVISGVAFEYGFDMTQFKKPSKIAFARQVESTFNNSRYEY